MKTAHVLSAQQITQAKEELRAAQLRQLGKLIGTEEESRMEIHYYPATCKNEILITSILTNQGDCADSLQEKEPEAFLMLQGILHEDHHTSYQDSTKRTIRIYHLPAPEQKQMALPQPMMLVFSVSESACEVTTADSNQVVITKVAAQLVNDHILAGGAVLWRETPPEGDIEFWQSKMRRGIEP